MTMDFSMKYFLAALVGAIAIMLVFYFADRGVLATAAKYADDEPKLVEFMRDMGYPKYGEWCGEFAASIIKLAGGTPPSGAAVASNWRRYGTPDTMPRVGDVAVADRGVPTGETGSHVGFVTDVNLKRDTFTLESGNADSIYTTRRISCFSFHTPPSNVLSALTGNGFGKALTGLPLRRASVEVYPFGLAISSANPDDCGQGSLDTANYDEIHTGDGLQRVQAPDRACALHLPPADTPRFCPYAGMTPESTMDRPSGRCTATTTKGTQCLAWRVRASACFI
jgi:hypothetical protein